MFLKAKYKEDSKKQSSASLYHQLPETLETQHAKEAALLQNQVHLQLLLCLKSIESKSEQSLFFC